MIVIVGAGVSGLSLGLHLAEAGLPYVILEAGDRVGGVIRTLRVDGRLLELGPQRLRAVPELSPFLSRMGEMRSPSGEPDVLVARGGRLHPLPRSLADAAFTPAISFRGKVRAALEPLAAYRQVAPGISAGEHLRARVGREVYDTFLGPLFGGIYGSDPDRMDAHRTLLPGMSALDVGSLLGRLVRASAGRKAGGGLLDRAVVVPAEGMHTLPRVLAGLQPGAIRLGSAVRRVEPSADGGFRVSVAGGTLHAERVVLTTPPGPTAQMLGRSEPALARVLAGLRMNPLALVHLDVPELPSGLGFQVSFGEPLRMRGATFSGNLDGTGHTAVVFMGGMGDPDVVKTPDPVLARTAAREFTQVTRIPAHPLHVHRTAMPAWDRSWRGLDEMSIPPGLHFLSAWSGRPGVVGRVREAERLGRYLVAG